MRCLMTRAPHTFRMCKPAVEGKARGRYSADAARANVHGGLEVGAVEDMHLGLVQLDQFEHGGPEGRVSIEVCLAAACQKIEGACPPQTEKRFHRVRFWHDLRYLMSLRNAISNQKYSANLRTLCAAYGSPGTGGGEEHLGLHSEKASPRWGTPRASLQPLGAPGGDITARGVGVTVASVLGRSVGQSLSCHQGSLS